MSGLKIAVIRGIPIRIHPSFLLVIPFLGFAFSQGFREAAALAGIPPEELFLPPWVWGVGLALALFVCVLIHELAHSLYAISHGGKVEDITLMLIGGVSRLSEPPAGPRQEAVMAVVGPLASLAIGAVLLPLSVLADGWFDLRFALLSLGQINIFLGLFNLIPAFPMDGGRILRSLLTPRLGAVRATGVAAGVGKVLAVGFAILGLVSFNLILVLIAFFIFAGASQEAAGVKLTALARGFRVRELMMPGALSLPEELPVEEAVQELLRSRRDSVVVTDGAGGVRGVASLAAIRKVPPAERPRTLLGAIAVPTARVRASDDASVALRLLGQSELPRLAVVDGFELVGTIGRDDLARGLQLAELSAGRPSGGPWWQKRRA